MSMLGHNNCIFAGIDPDVHTTGVAYIADHLGKKPYLIYVDCIKSKKSTQYQAVINMARALRDHFRLEEGSDVPPRCTGFAVEAQEMYHGQTKNPRSIMFLANVAGAALQEMGGKYPNAYARFPKPSEWKAQLPKHVKQARGFNKLMITYDIKGSIDTGTAYCVPDLKGHDVITGKINYGDWKHIGDAVGLALWCRHQYYHMLKTRELRKNRV